MIAPKRKTQIVKMRSSSGKRTRGITCMHLRHGTRLFTAFTSSSHALYTPGLGRGGDVYTPPALGECRQERTEKFHQKRSTDSAQKMTVQVICARRNGGGGASLSALVRRKPFEIGHHR